MFVYNKEHILFKIFYLLCKNKLSMHKFSFEISYTCLQLIKLFDIHTFLIIIIMKHFILLSFRSICFSCLCTLTHRVSLHYIVSMCMIRLHRKKDDVMLIFASKTTRNFQQLFEEFLKRNCSHILSLYAAPAITLKILAELNFSLKFMCVAVGMQCYVGNRASNDLVLWLHEL